MKSFAKVNWSSNSEIVCISGQCFMIGYGTGAGESAIKATLDHMTMDPLKIRFLIKAQNFVGHI